MVDPQPMSVRRKKADAQGGQFKRSVKTVFIFFQKQVLLLFLIDILNNTINMGDVAVVPLRTAYCPDPLFSAFTGYQLKFFIEIFPTGVKVVKVLPNNWLVLFDIICGAIRNIKLLRLPLMNVVDFFREIKLSFSQIILPTAN